MKGQESIARLSLPELQTKSQAVISLLNSPKSDLREFGQMLAYIAKTESLKRSYNKAEELALDYGFTKAIANQYAKATRFLAMMLRDFGKSEFDSFIG